MYTPHLHQVQSDVLTTVIVLLYSHNHGDSGKSGRNRVRYSRPLLVTQLTSFHTQNNVQTPTVLYNEKK